MSITRDYEKMIDDYFLHTLRKASKAIDKKGFDTVVYVLEITSKLD